MAKVSIAVLGYNHFVSLEETAGVWYVPVRISG